MSDVEFDTDTQFQVPMSPSIGIVRAENKMAEWLMRKGIAKSQNQAQLMLLSVAGAAVVIAIGVWLLFNQSDTSGQTYKGPLIPINSTVSTHPSNGF